MRPRPDGFSRPNSGMRVSPSCRDKGRMWGRVGALCLSSSLFDSLGFREARWSHPNEDKHKAPSSTPPLVPTGRGTHISRFDCQPSSGIRGMCLKPIIRTLRDRGLPTQGCRAVNPLQRCMDCNKKSKGRDDEYRTGAGRTAQGIQG